MRLGLMLGYAAGQIELPLELVQEADRQGVYAVWTAEAYGSDAISPLAWLGAQTDTIKLGTAIMQMPGRTPANAAMTAMTMNQLSGGRFLMGLGLSGPQVVEGWHGVGYRKPLTRTREYVAIVRHIFRRESPLTFDGDIYQIPYEGDDATGLGKPLKSTLGAQPDIPIYLAAIGPQNVELAAEIADGWLPIFFAPDRYDDDFQAPCRRRAGQGRQDARHIRHRPHCFGGHQRQSGRVLQHACGRCWPFTLAEWARAARTSTRTWPVDMASRRKRPRFRTCTCPVIAAAPWLACPLSSSTPLPSSARASASATACSCGRTAR